MTGSDKPRVQPLEERQDFTLGRAVQRRQRLVHQQQLRLRQQSPPDRDALPFAAGQLVRRPVQQACKSEQCDDLVEADAGGFRRSHVTRRAVKQVGSNREMREQARLLEHVADWPLVSSSEGRWVLPDLAVDRAEASGQVLQAGQTARHGGLAAAGRAEDRGDAGGWNGETGVQPKRPDRATKRGQDSTGFVRGRVRRHARTPALRFSISIMVRITANANTTMPPARMLASRHRDAST